MWGHDGRHHDVRAQLCGQPGCASKERRQRGNDHERRRHSWHRQKFGAHGNTPLKNEKGKGKAKVIISRAYCSQLRDEIE